MTRNRKRAFIENVRPLVDAGTYPLKREPGDGVKVIADIFRDGHQKVAAWVEYRPVDRKKWHKVPMTCTNPGMDLWETEFKVDQVGFYEYMIVAYCEEYGTWVFDTRKKVDANVDYSSDILEGMAMAKNYRAWLNEADREYLKNMLQKAEKAGSDLQRWHILSHDRLVELLAEHPDPASRVESKTFMVRVDRTDGTIAVLGVHEVLDCGRSIVPELVSGMAQGGIAMGLGHALTEYLPLYEDGPGNGSWNVDRYDVVRARDVPVWDMILETLPPAGPDDAPRGMAEIVMVPVVPAVLNAIHDATGKRFTRLPVTADDILKAR